MCRLTEVRQKIFGEDVPHFTGFRVLLLGFRAERGRFQRAYGGCRRVLKFEDVALIYGGDHSRFRVSKWEGLSKTDLEAGT